MWTILHLIFSLLRHPVFIITALIALLAFAVFNGVVEAPKIDLPKVFNEEKNKREEKPSFDKTRYSIDDPNSIWVIVNKQRPLPDGFTPSSLVGGVRSEVKPHLDRLVADGANSGYNLRIISSYRSQQTQTGTYNRFVRADGQANADTYSARPRHSEHQTGLAVDLGNGVCDLQACFGSQPAGRWLAENAHEYGFIVRYQEGKQAITGFTYEPWHLRYVGQELATELHKIGQTMEEFFGLPTAPNY